MLEQWTRGPTSSKVTARSSLEGREKQSFPQGPPKQFMMMVYPSTITHKPDFLQASPAFRQHLCQGSKDSVPLALHLAKYQYKARLPMGPSSVVTWVEGLSRSLVAMYLMGSSSLLAPVPLSSMQALCLPGGSGALGAPAPKVSAGTEIVAHVPTIV